MAPVEASMVTQKASAAVRIEIAGVCIGVAIATVAVLLAEEAGRESYLGRVIAAHPRFSQPFEMFFLGAGIVAGASLALGITLPRRKAILYGLAAVVGAWCWFDAYYWLWACRECWRVWLGHSALILYLGGGLMLCAGLIRYLWRFFSVRLKNARHLGS
jgi:hypothetical protein